MTNKKFIKFKKKKKKRLVAATSLCRGQATCARMIAIFFYG